MEYVLLAILAAVIALIGWQIAVNVPRTRSARRNARTDDIATMIVSLHQGHGLWSAIGPGECGTCGHDWHRGELVGAVTQSFEKDDAGKVWRSPGVRVVCGACVERTRAEGDLTVPWARESGLI